MASTSNTSSSQEVEEIAPSTFNSGGSTMSAKERGYDVVISHAKDPLAGFIGETLNAMELKSFLNSKELELEDEEVEAAIKSSSIYIPILSEDHAQSSRCLEELLLMHRREGAKIIPIFHNVKPEDARYLKGAYAAAFDRYKDNDEHPAEKLEEWKEALSSVSECMGHVIERKEDEDILLSKIPVEFASANTSSSIHLQRESRKSTTSRLDYDVFINHRGVDVNQTLAKAIYTNLKTMRVKAFLDLEELRWGDHVPSVLHQAISSVKVHITMFSPKYAQSAWCLRELELMLKTKATIVPIFHVVSPEDLRSSMGAYVNAVYRYKREGTHTSEKVAEWKM